MQQDIPGSFEPPQAALTASWLSRGGPAPREGNAFSRPVKYVVASLWQRQTSLVGFLTILIARPRFCSSSHAPNCMWPRHH